MRLVDGYLRIDAVKLFLSVDLVDIYAYLPVDQLLDIFSILLFVESQQLLCEFGLLETVLYELVNSAHLINLLIQIFIIFRPQSSHVCYDLVGMLPRILFDHFF